MGRALAALALGLLRCLQAQAQTAGVELTLGDDAVGVQDSGQEGGSRLFAVSADHKGDVEIPFELTIGYEIVVVDKDQWENCIWSSPTGSELQCEATGVVRVPLRHLAVDAQMRARASLDGNSTIYGGVVDRAGGSLGKAMCEASRFRLVLCGIPLADGSAPIECGDASIQCARYSIDHSWCSVYHPVYIWLGFALYAALLVVVVYVIYQVLQDLGWEPAHMLAKTEGADVDGQPASPGDSDRARFRGVLGPRLSEDLDLDRAAGIGPLLQRAFHNCVVDILWVHVLLCMNCGISAVYFLYHDDYDTGLHYIAEGGHFAVMETCYLCVLSMFLDKADVQAFTGENGRKVVERARKWLVGVYLVLNVALGYCKYKKEQPDAEDFWDNLYACVKFIIAAPPAVAAVLLLVSLLVKTFKRGADTALQVVDDASRMLTSTLLTSSIAMEGRLPGAPAAEDGGTEPAAPSSSDWTQQTIVRWMRFGIIEALLLFTLVMVYGMEHIAGQAVEGFGCLGCQCKLEGAKDYAGDNEYTLFRRTDVACDAVSSKWLKMEGEDALNNPTTMMDLADGAKIVDNVLKWLIDVVILAFMIFERRKAKERETLFRDRHGAGASSMKSGDGEEAESHFTSCVELVSTPEELNYVMAQIVNSKTLSQQKAQADKHRAAGDNAAAVRAYQTALIAAPQCEMVRELLRLTDHERERSELQEQRESSEKHTIMSAASLQEMALPGAVVVHGQAEVDAAQRLLGRLQAALSLENINRGEPGRWVIVSCMAVSTDANTSEAVVICLDTKLNDQFTAKTIFAPDSWQASWQQNWTPFEPGVKEHLLQQVDLLRSVNNDRLARLVEASFMAYDTVFFCRFDMLEGETLAEKLDREGGCMDEHETIKLALDVLPGIGAMHERKLLHSVVNPKHLVHVSGTWKLRTWSVLRIPRQAAGLHPEQQDACHYLAPEQVSHFLIYQSPACFTDPLTILSAVQAAQMLRASGEDDDPRSDLYSVGVLMFRALTGKLPIADGETDVAKIVNAAR